MQRKYAIFEAIRSGDLRLVRAELTATPACVYEKSITGALPYEVAVDCHRWDMVLALLQHDPNQLAPTKSPCLLAAAITQSVPESVLIEIVLAAPDHVCQPLDDLLQKRTEYPIHAVIAAGLSDTLDVILLHCPHQLAICDDDGNSLAHLICQSSTLSLSVVATLAALRPRLLQAITTNDDNQTPLHCAIESRCASPAMLASFQAAHSGENHTSICLVRDRQGYLPLHVAMAERQWTTMAALATWCPETVAETDPVGDLPIHVAAAYRQWDLVETLVQLAPATASRRDRLGRSLLAVALGGQAWHCAKILVGLELDPLPTYDVDVVIQFEQWDLAAMLLYAMREPLVDPQHTLYLCCKYGAPSYILGAVAPTVATIEAIKPLDIALKHKHWETAACVLSLHVASARIKNATRLLPLQVAVAQEAPPWLLQRLASAYPSAALCVDARGNPLVHVMSLRQRWACVSALLEASPRVADTRDALGFSLLERLIERMAPATVLLCALAASPFTCSTKGIWCLASVLQHYALALTGHDLDTLTATVASRSFADSAGNSALHVAVLSGNVLFCRSLLRRANNIFLRNADGHSPHALAMQSSSLELRRLFEPLDGSAGGLPNEWLSSTDCDGKTPLDHAISAGALRVVQWMLQRGGIASTPIERLSPHSDVPLPTQAAIRAELTAAQHSRLVLHGRYLIEAMPTDNSDDTVMVTRALDLLSGAYVQLRGYQAADTCHAECAHVQSVQRQSQRILGVLDAFSDKGIYYAVVSHGVAPLRTIAERSSTQRHDIASSLVQAIYDLHIQAKCVALALAAESFLETSSYEYQLTDALACVPMDEAVAIPRLWTLYATASKRQYMSPCLARQLLPVPTTESADEGIVVTPSDNLWGLGVILYELWSGAPWLEDLDANLFSAMHAIARQADDEPSAIETKVCARGLSTAMNHVLLQMLLPSSPGSITRILHLEYFASTPNASALPTELDADPADATTPTMLQRYSSHELVALALESHRQQFSKALQQQEDHVRVVAKTERKLQKLQLDLATAMERKADAVSAQLSALESTLAQQRVALAEPVSSLPPSNPVVDVAPSDAVKNAPNTNCVSTEEHICASYVGLRVRKAFEDGNVYHGSVGSLRFVGPPSRQSALWTIEYDDGDSEDVAADELEGLLLAPLSLPVLIPRKKPRLRGHFAKDAPPIGRVVWLLAHTKLVATGVVCSPPTALHVSSDCVALVVRKYFAGAESY
ncbi:hypothetical protein SDRG_04259 [Saprolegnia diclina VS20]|uniref:PTM/DIR17-like Tudor domain-containing protein n=1 Tax=Saprolegnia diclina (strain VS20) TaxID=1156394 RepID=T0QKL3_SAPDV|nr:hypothetical protein SDRG_04259 [Saprolegnia diclina VS20]EQC38554.1 hypothetical protein SDRG_04259 [Saprolegnia diclina VS20]|eukprot:XP_008608146.1 hypothetical protein SDRG_04259 [Saprolegnia diclina VS20]